MKHINYNFILAGAFILGCGNSTSSKDQTKRTYSDEKSCLEQYVDSPCDILSTEKILDLTGLETSKIEIKEPTTNKVAGRLQCVYLWYSGRIEQVKTSVGSIDSELNDKIDLGHFRLYDKNEDGMNAEDWFKNSYPIITKEEIAIREARYNDKLANGEKSMVEEILIRTYKNLERKRIQDLGDRALVDISKNFSVATVIVMDKNISFQLSVDISKDVQKNLEVAKKVARSVLEACD